MMGRQGKQCKLFRYHVDLDNRIRPEHPLRQLIAAVQDIAILVKSSPKAHVAILAGARAVVSDGLGRFARVLAELRLAAARLISLRDWSSGHLCLPSV